MRSKYFWLTYFVLLGMVVLRLVPFIYPESRSWGFNHLIFLPDSYSIGFFVIAFVALIIPFIKSSEKWGEALSDWFSSCFFESDLKYLYRIIFIAFMTSLFIIFRAPTHFLGDGYVVINNIAKPEGVHFKWSEIGITNLLNIIVPMFGSYNETNALLTFQIVSIVSGATSIFFYFLIAEISFYYHYKKTLLFILLTFSGSLLLFFGYAEYYPIIWAFMTGFIYFSLKFLKNGKGLISAWLFLLIGVLLHVQMVIFIPAAIYLPFSTRKGLEFYYKNKKTIWLILVFGLISGLLTLANQYSTDLYVEDMFLPLFKGRPLFPDYAIFSFSHLLDIFNEFILISPFLFLFIFLTGRNIKYMKSDKSTVFLAIGTIGSLLFLFLIDPKLGFPRDWDLFSISGIFLMMLSVTLIDNNTIRNITKLVIPMVLVLSIYSLPFLITNLNKENSIQYVKYLINLDKAKSLSSFVILSSYYKNSGDSHSLDSLNKIKKELYPDKFNCDMAMIALNNGDIEMAVDFIDAIKPDSLNPMLHRILSLYYYQLGDYPKALYHIDGAIELRKYASRYYPERSRIYMAMGKFDNALADLKEGQLLNPKNRIIIEGLAYFYNEIDDFDLSIKYSLKLLEIDSQQPVAYYWIARAYLKKGDKIKAHSSAKRYFEFALSDSVFILNSRELQLMLNQSNEIQ